MQLQSDTLVYVPINSIRSANEKLLEREKFCKIIIEQEEIIKNYNKMIALKEDTISIYENAYNETYKLNEELSKNLARKERMNYILIGTTSISLIGLITCLLIK